VTEVGYWVAAEARGRGLCPRAVSLVSRWLIAEHGVERVQLRADVENVPSRRVAEKAGFTQEGVLRSSRYNPRLGRRINFVMYSLLRDELDAA
jgi:RimJ/RimL family protein N-acetyltransferase